MKPSYEELERYGRQADITIENLERKVEQLAAENAGLKSAFDKPDAWLSWHSIPPTFYEPDRGGEYLQVHEKAGEKNDDGSDSWPVYRKPETETPATDAILAEVRAQGVGDFCKLLESYAKVEPERFNPQFADLYAKIANRIFSEVMDNPEVYDLGTMSDWLEREAENSRAYADMSLAHHSQLRQEAK
ncbi:TPA: hypothetical protein OB695_000177 [Escherichia coli]|nr:hypothetical protein [Escherichia coli]